MSEYSESVESKDIYVWPDDSWCYPAEYSEYDRVSDDYFTTSVPVEWDDEDIEYYLTAIPRRESYEQQSSSNPG